MTENRIIRVLKRVFFWGGGFFSNQKRIYYKRSTRTIRFVGSRPAMPVMSVTAVFGFQRELHVRLIFETRFFFSLQRAFEEKPFSRILFRCERYLK